MTVTDGGPIISQSNHDGEKMIVSLFFSSNLSYSVLLFF